GPVAVPPRERPAAAGGGQGRVQRTVPPVDPLHPYRVPQPVRVDVRPRRLDRRGIDFRGEEPPRPSGSVIPPKLVAVREQPRRQEEGVHRARSRADVQSPPRDPPRPVREPGQVPPAARHEVPEPPDVVRPVRDGGAQPSLREGRQDESEVVEGEGPGQRRVERVVGPRAEGTAPASAPSGSPAAADPVQRPSELRVGRPEGGEVARHGEVGDAVTVPVADSWRDRDRVGGGGVGLRHIGRRRWRRSERRAVRPSVPGVPARDISAAGCVLLARAASPDQRRLSTVRQAIVRVMSSPKDVVQQHINHKMKMSQEFQAL
ncbi:hypothetical protein THAOC_15658, partial [Thalassiosira oceanica]